MARLRSFLMTSLVMLGILLCSCSCVPTPAPEPQPEPPKRISLEVNGVFREFDTLREAVEACKSQGKNVIRLYNDIVLDGQITVDGKEVVIVADGRNVLITRNFTGTKDGNNDGNRMFTVKNGGSLTMGVTGAATLTIDGTPHDGEDLSDRQVFACGTFASDIASSLALNAGVTVQNNRTTGKGSAVLVNGQFTLDGAALLNNSTSDNGGAVQVSYNGNFHMSRGTVKGNSASYGGGMNIAYTASATLSGGSFENNRASTGGGNIYLGGKACITCSNITVTGGQLNGVANDIGLGQGTAASPTTLKFNGTVVTDNIEVRGANVRIALNAPVVPGRRINLSSTVKLDEAQRVSLITGSASSTGFYAFRFAGATGRMFDDDSNVRMRFFDAYFTETEESMWGDCTYVEFPDGTNMLIDCSYEETGNAIAKVLWSYGIEKVDYFVASHFHSDHVNGFFSLVERAKMDIGNFISSTYQPLSYTRIDSDIKSAGIKRTYWSSGSAAKIGGADFNVIWPNQADLTPVPERTSKDTDPYEFVLGNNTDMNSKSLVFTVKFGGNTVLFTGDVYKVAEAAILDQNSLDLSVLKCDVIKAPHHGKETSSSTAFIAAADPDYAVAMVTRHVPPASDYQAAGATFYETRYSGDVYVTLTPDAGYSVTTQKSPLTSK